MKFHSHQTQPNFSRISPILRKLQNIHISMITVEVLYNLYCESWYSIDLYTLVNILNTTGIEPFQSRHFQNQNSIFQSSSNPIFLKMNALSEY